MSLMEVVNGGRRAPWHRLEQRREPHAAEGAERHDAMTGGGHSLGPHHAREQAHDEHRAGGAERMPADDRAPVRIDERVVELQAARERDGLGGRAFAHFDETYVLALEAVEAAVKPFHGLDG